jgi:hypothetical protein
MEIAYTLKLAEALSKSALRSLADRERRSMLRLYPG